MEWRKKGGSSQTSSTLATSSEQGTGEHRDRLDNPGAGLWMGSAAGRCLGGGGRASRRTPIAIFAALDAYAGTSQPAGSLVAEGHHSFSQSDPGLCSSSVFLLSDPGSA